MRVVVSEFMSLDGVVQAPGGPEEDTDDGVGRSFDLVDVQVAATGVLVCTYRPVGDDLRTGHSDDLYQDGAPSPTGG